MNKLLFADHEVFVKKLTGIVLANLHNDNFGVNDLAMEAGLSRSAVHRRLWVIKRQNISQFIREIRLKRAMELLQLHTCHASEIAYKVGFRSPAYFNKCFHDYYGYPPGEVMKRAFTEDRAVIRPDAVEPATEEFPAREPVPEEGLTRESLTEVPAPEGQAVSGRSPISLLTIRKAGRWQRRDKVTLVSAAAMFIFALTWLLNHNFVNETDISGLSGSRDNDISIIVLPFKNFSDDPGNQYFADGIGEDILNHLCNITTFRVASRTSADQFREGNLSAPEIARKMNVSHVLEGSVRRQDHKVRVNVQLIDARRDRHLWSENYDRQMTDVFAIQSDIAINVVRELQSILTPAETEQDEEVPYINPETYKAKILRLLKHFRKNRAGVLPLFYFS